MPKPKSAVTENEQQFRTLADSMAQLVWMAHPDGYIFWYNRRWYEYTGTTPQQMEGWGWQSVHDPVELPRVLDRWRASIRDGNPFDMEFPLRGADGSFRWFLTRIIPVRDGKGKIIRWFGTNTDVNELRRTQEALRRSEQKLRISEESLRLTQRAANIGSWELDVDSEQYVWSDEVRELLGQPQIPATQKSLLSMMYFSTDRQNMIAALKVAITRNKEMATQFRIVRPDGEVRWIAARGRSFFNQGKSLMLGVFLDITDEQEAIQADMAAKKKSRGASTQKTAKRKPR